MNFWADVAFTPSSSGSITAKASSPASHSIAVGGFGPSASTSDQSSHFFISAPASHTGGAGSLRRRIARDNAHVLGSLSYRRPIPQAATLASWLKKSSFTFGSV